jgi:hypothetical protein
MLVRLMMVAGLWDVVDIGSSCRSDRIIRCHSLNDALLAVLVKLLGSEIDRKGKECRVIAAGK